MDDLTQEQAYALREILERAFIAGQNAHPRAEFVDTPLEQEHFEIFYRLCDGETWDQMFPNAETAPKLPYHSATYFDWVCSLEPRDGLESDFIEDTRAMRSVHKQQDPDGWADTLSARLLTGCVEACEVDYRLRAAFAIARNTPSDPNGA